MENEVVQTVMFIGIVCSVIFAMSRRTIDLLLGFLKCLVDATIKLSGAEDPLCRISKSILKDSRAVRERFRLDGKMTVYAVCPKCHSIYEPTLEGQATGSTYPLTCSSVRNIGGPQCGEPLTRPASANGKPIDKPIKPFVYHSVLDYMSGLASQLPIETALDKACDDLLSNPDASVLGSNPCHGPFEAEFLKKFPGPQPNKLFIDRGNELRLAFSLNVDFFNIQGVRASGATTSCGIISLVCLNLPENIRYKSENMFIAGIIPGPREPKLTAINSYMKPLIDDMIDLWSPGVRLSRTASSQHGRVARGAIVIVASDLPAARKLAALLSFSSSKFLCSVCKATSDKIGEFDIEFSIRDPIALRREADRWRLTGSRTEQQAIEDEYGTRWSELWRLSYWDPTEQLVVDPMHCLLEGLVQNHFRFVLALTSAEAANSYHSEPAYPYEFEEVPSKETNPNHPIHTKGSDQYLNDLQIKNISSIHDLLRAPVYCDPADVERGLEQLKGRLMKMQRKSLAFVFDSMHLDAVSLPRRNDVVSKLRYSYALATWVSIYRHGMYSGHF